MDKRHAGGKGEPKETEGAGTVADDNATEILPEPTGATSENPSPETQTDSPESSVQPPPETPPEPTVAEKAVAWDKNRQIRDEERAAREKARDDEIARLKQTVDDLAKTKTPVAPQGPSDDDLQAMADEIAARTDPTNSEKYDLDEARKLEIKWRNATLQQTKALKAAAAKREARDAEAEATESGWTKWEQDNPDCDAEKAKKIWKECNAEARKFGARNQEEALPAANMLFKQRFAETKKSKVPAAKPPVTRTTVPSADASTPINTRVTPSSGAREEPIQQKQVAKGILDFFKRTRG